MSILFFLINKDFIFYSRFYKKLPLSFLPPQKSPRTYIIILCANFRYESIHLNLFYYTIKADKNLINYENYSQQTYKTIYKHNT